MPWHRILNVFGLEKVVWEKWPEFGANQFMSQGPDRLRLETQNRLPEHGGGPASHIHKFADTVHIILEGEGEYVLAPNVWVPARPGDIFLTRGGEVHGGRGTNPEKPLKYIVIEGPTPEDISRQRSTDPRNADEDPFRAMVIQNQIQDDDALVSNWGLEEVPEETVPRIGFNGGIAGTNVLLGGPDQRPAWMDYLPEDAYTD